MRIPNAIELCQDKGFAESLLKRIGRSQTWIAAKSGISKRRIQYLITGHRTDNTGAVIPVHLSYPEQFLLETFADMPEAMEKLPK